MKSSRVWMQVSGALWASLAVGCAAPQVDFSKIHKPDRAPELEAYKVFVGSWNWTARVANAIGADKDWTGSADWSWTLDERCLRGHMAAGSANTSFQGEGLWSWNPKTHDYVWTLFNSWGYPQEGTAKYDAASRTWVMNYTAIGLDGTTSHGRYQIKVVDNDTLDWQMTEWADAMHMFPKLAMTGAYRRARAGETMRK